MTSVSRLSHQTFGKQLNSGLRKAKDNLFQSSDEMGKLPFARFLRSPGQFLDVRKDKFPCIISGSQCAGLQ